MELELKMIVKSLIIIEKEELPSVVFKIECNDGLTLLKIEFVIFKNTDIHAFGILLFALSARNSSLNFTIYLAEIPGSSKWDKCSATLISLWEIILVVTVGPGDKSTRREPRLFIWLFFNFFQV